MAEYGFSIFLGFIPITIYFVAFVLLYTFRSVPYLNFEVLDFFVTIAIEL